MTVGTQNTPEDPHGVEGENENLSQDAEPHGEEVDWKSEARKWEARAKENKAKADQSEAKFKELKAANERAALAEKISNETGVPVSLIQGSTKEEMESFAQENAHYFVKDTVPVIGSDGRTPNTPERTKDPIRELFNNK